MRIRKKILKIIIIGFIFLGVPSIWYVNQFLGPTTLRLFFAKSIGRVIERPVALDSVHFNLIHGFTLNGLTIYEPDGKTVFVKVKHLSTTLLFIPVLTDKKIIIPSIQVNSPSINIIKKQDNTWNFLSPPLIKTAPASERPKRKGFSFLVQKVQISGGEIKFLDNSKTPAYTRQLVNLNGEVAFSITEGAINFKTTSQLNNLLKTNIGLGGSYFLNEKLFIIKATAKNLSVSDSDYFYKDKAGFPVNLKDGLADIALDLKIDKEKKLLFAVNSLIKNLDASYADLNLKGDMGINGTFELTPSEPPRLNYNVELDLKNPTLKGVYLLNEISNLNGKVEISNDAVRSTRLEGYAYNTPIKFSGGIDLKTLQLRLNTEAAMDLVNYKNFLPPKLREGFKDVNFEGPAQVSIKFFDRLKDPQSVDMDGEIKFKGAALNVPTFPNRIEKIFGEILFKNDVIYISRASFDYGAENYVLDAKITNLASPDVKLKLNSKELSLNSRFNVLKDKTHILMLAGKYGNSSFKATGDIKKSESSNIISSGAIALDLLDLRKLFPGASASLTNFGLRGNCDLEFNVNGPLKEPKALEVVIKGKSSVVSFWNLKFNEVGLNLQMKDSRFLVQELSAKPYDGNFFATMEIDLSQQNPPYTINLDMEEVDLSKLALDTNLKNKQISGKALCKSNIRGYGKNLETIRGEGFIFVKGGNLWEVPLLKGLAELLFMPKLSSIVFDEASTHFAIANKAASTSDLKLHSQHIGLLGEGNLFFDGAIDLLITTSISENFIKGTSEFERLTGALLAEAGQFIGRIKVAGTVKKPEYKFMPFPIDQILKDKLKGLLGGFF